MSSEPHRNFFLIVMDSIIYKYDLVSKDLLFQFKTNASLEMILYDGDDKLCVASDNIIRLWDFFDNREVPPALWSSHEFVGEKILRVFLNENSKGPFLFIVVTNIQNYIFEDRLELRSKITLDAKYMKVLSVAFNQESTFAYLGTSNGYLIKWNLITGQQEGDAIVASKL